jgi:parallel beta-helix repeat protein
MILIGTISFQNDIIVDVTAAKAIYVPGNYTSIQAAIDNATPGDTIYVWAGTYYENVVVNKTVSIIGNGSKDTIIDGGGVEDVVKITADWVNVSGFKLINSGNKYSPIPDSGIKLKNVHNVSVLNNNCSFNTVGIFLEWSTSNTILNNNLYSNNYEGIDLFHSHLNKVINNSCISNRDAGIRAFFSNSNEILGNTCMYHDYFGITSEYSLSNKISNNTCKWSKRCGLFFNGTDFNIIVNNTSEWNDIQGMIFINSNSNSILDNTCMNNFDCGIVFFKNSNFNSIKNNYCLNNEIGIAFSYSNSNKILNNTCNLNNWSGIGNQNSDGNIIENNCCELNNVSDITFEGTTSAIVKNNTLSSKGLYFNTLGLEQWNTHIIDTSNTVDGKPIYYWKNRSGGTIPTDAGQIIIANCTNVHIENFNFQNKTIAISIGYSSGITISNNTLSNNRFSIWLLSSNSNIIYNNTGNLSDNYGIFLRSSSNNIVENNTFNMNYWHGIALLNSDCNTIVNNNASKNKCGIFLNFSDNNVIANNDFFSNTYNGIRIRNSNNNNIYHNNIINNAIQALELDNSNNNHWDNGNGEGNFWSDYDGVDNGTHNRIVGDGIGDSDIPHTNLDYYPFMNRSGWLYPGNPILFNPSNLDSDGCYLISWFPSRGTCNYILEEDLNPAFKSPKIIYTGPEIRFQINNRPNGTYYYRLKALSVKYESPWSNIVAIEVDWPPNVPQNLSVHVYPGGNALNISWDIDAEDVDIYELYFRSDKISTWTFLTSIPDPEHTFAHTNLKDGRKYEYKVQALDGLGQNSTFSEVKAGIPKDSIAPKPPKGFTIIEITPDSIELGWVPNNEADLVGYNIYRYNISNLSGWGDHIGTVMVGEESFVDDDLNELTLYYYVITAFDEVPNESNLSAMVMGTTKQKIYGPEINNSVENFQIDEDCIDNFTINLYDWFCDLNSDPLIFWCEGDDFINVTIFQENGTVILKPKPNWHGREILTFYASDGKLNCSDKVKVTVNSINDAPDPPKIIEPNNNTQIYYGMLLDFLGKCNDSDLPEDELTFKWNSDNQGNLGLGDQLFGVTLIPGKHVITLTVSDNDGYNSSSQITVFVLKSTPSAKSDEINVNLIIGTISGVIVLIFLILLCFTLYMKKRSNKIEKSKVYEPPVSRFSFLSIPVSDNTFNTSDNEKLKRIEPPKQKQSSSQPRQRSISKLSQVHKQSPSAQQQQKNKKIKAI